MNLSDDQLLYVKKNYKQLSISRISKDLNLPLKAVYFAIEGLFGITPPSLVEIYREKIELGFRIFSFAISIALMFLLMTMEFSIEAIVYSFIFLTINFISIFSKSLIFKSINIERSPHDFIFITCFFFFFVNIFLSPEPIFAICSSLIVLMSGLIHFNLLQTFKDTTFLLFSNTLVNGIGLLAIFDATTRSIAPSTLNTHLALSAYLALPLCFFSIIYYQKKAFHLWWFTLLSVTLILKVSSQNNSLLLISTMLFFVTLAIIQNRTKSKLFHSKQLRYSLAVQSLAIGFCLISNDFVLDLDMLTTKSHSLLSAGALISSYESLIYSNEILENYGLVFLLFLGLATIKFIFISTKNIYEADCFTEKIYAQIPFVLTIQLISYFIVSTQILNLTVFIWIGIILAMSSAIHHYHRLDKGDRIKIKKIINFKRLPASILVVAFLINLIWFAISYREMLNL